jgi:hypothetical protein
MNKKFLIELTKNLYQLTLLFPKKEPLRYKMRELATDILADGLRNTKKYEYTKETNRDPFSAKLIETRSLQILEKLEVLDGFFEVAKAQNWVSPVEILRIQEEYSRIKAEIKKIPKKPVTEVKPEVEAYMGQTPVEVAGVRPLQSQHRSDPGQTLLNERQQKILEFLKENGRVQVWQAKQIFPEVSKRTLRRDFEFLLKQGKIERIGERNETFYVPRQGAGQLLG